MEPVFGRIGDADRATRATPQAPTGLDHSATIPCAAIIWHGVNGPVLTRSDGTAKWLSWRERFMLWVGRWSLDDIAARLTGAEKLVYYPPASIWLTLGATDAHLYGRV